MKILIEMKHGLGDCICAIPMIEQVRSLYPKAYIAMIVDGKINEELFRHSKVKIDKFYYFSLKKYSFWQTLKVLLSLRREHFDIGICSFITPASRIRRMFQLLGIKKVYGEQFNTVKNDDTLKHFVERNLLAIEGMCNQESGVTPSMQAPILFARKEKLLQFEQLLRSKKNLIAINVGGGDLIFPAGKPLFTRKWGNEKILSLIKTLVQRNYNVVLLGGNLEKVVVEGQSILDNDRVTNFVGRTSIAETIAILSFCKVSIGVDTGVQHIASALGVPTISIFGPTNPMHHGAFWGKRYFVESKENIECKYCYGKDEYISCNNRRCLDTIAVEDVVNLVEKEFPLDE